MTPPEVMILGRPTYSVPSHSVSARVTMLNCAFVTPGGKTKSKFVAT